jgi:hypothetical protein
MNFQRHTFQKITIDSVPGAVWTARSKTASEEAAFMDELIQSDDKKPMPSDNVADTKALIELVVQDVTGLVDESGSIVEFPKNTETGKVDQWFIDGFTMSQLRNIYGGLSDIGKMKEATKKKS